MAQRLSVELMTAMNWIQLPVVFKQLSTLLIDERFHTSIERDVETPFQYPVERDPNIAI